uniref:Sorting nexin 29 n=1 Tax=Oryctolagus cuniculus TaxID=9986 RepID=A0A5F9DV21_RABIT
MSASQNNDKRQFLLERLLDAVKQCQIRFGGRKEIASDSDSRVTCLCAQFEAVLQHGLKRSRGLALTAAAIKQAAGFASKTETEPVFWSYVREALSRHELQRFYGLRHIASDVGRGRAWLRCALNEHSLERYLHTLLADRGRLSTFYEDWSFVMDEERSSMLPTMAAGLNSILFAINIDNKDLNGQSKFAPTVSDLLKESTQNMTSLLKESTQGVSSLLREITASSAVSILIRPEQETDPLPVVCRSVSADARSKKERKKKKKVTNIISFDDEEDEQNSGDVFKKIPGAGESSEENSDRSSINIVSAFESPFGPNSNGSQSSSSWKIDSVSLNGEFGYQKLDVKSIDDEDADDNEDDVYANSSGRKRASHSESPEKPLDGNGCLSQMHGWAPLQVLHGDADVLFPVSGVGSYSPADAPLGSLENGTGPEDHVVPEPGLRFSVEASSPGHGSPLSSLLPAASVPESMTVSELRQAIVAMMNRKDELEEENRSLRSLLDGEMEHSAALRQEVDALKKKVEEQEERHTTKVQALARENEVLKVQLKKYVGAVQMLKREGQTAEVVPNLWSVDGDVPVAAQKPGEATEELASSYERKLIEVAEMHGELIEFNERLHRALVAKEALVSQMRQELIDLRGPIQPGADQRVDPLGVPPGQGSERVPRVPGKFMYTKAADDGGDRDDNITSCHGFLPARHGPSSGIAQPPSEISQRTEARGLHPDQGRRVERVPEVHRVPELAPQAAERLPSSAGLQLPTQEGHRKQGCQVRGGTKKAAAELPAQRHEQSHPGGPRVCRQPQEGDTDPAHALLRGPRPARRAPQQQPAQSGFPLPQAVPGPPQGDAQRGTPERRPVTSARPQMWAQILRQVPPTRPWLPTPDFPEQRHGHHRIPQETPPHGPRAIPIKLVSLGAGQPLAGQTGAAQSCPPGSALGTRGPSSSSGARQRGGSRLGQEPLRRHAQCERFTGTEGRPESATRRLPTREPE